MKVVDLDSGHYAWLADGPSAQGTDADATAACAFEVSNINNLEHEMAYEVDVPGGVPICHGPVDGGKVTEHVLAFAQTSFVKIWCKGEAKG